MLPYALAITVGLSSSVLFVTAFFLPDIHRQDDFFWSGIGLFYALVLWFCATSITGAVLLGQLAVVALLTAYFWQVLKLRKAIVNPELQDSLDDFSVVNFLKNLFTRSPVTKSTIEATQSKAATVTQKPTPTEKVATKTTPTTTPIEKEVAIKTTPTTAPTAEISVDNTPLVKTTLSDIATKGTVEESAPSESPNLTTEKTPSVVNTESTEIVKETPKTQNTATENSAPTSIETSTTETKNPRITEITIEKVTIVEEETNWDDEVEEIPASSVTIIEEEATIAEDRRI